MEPLALGIDVGGTNTKYGFVNRRGEVVAKGSIATEGHATPYDFVQAITTAVLPWMAHYGKSNVLGAGIGAPNGNHYTGEIKFAPNLPWRGIIPLAKLVHDALGIKALLTNDANAAAIGEMQYGAAKGMKDFVVVTLGTGLGSGFVANGQLIYGHDGFAGELGHVIVEKSGRLCGCGRRGCLETYASATGIVKTATLWLEQRHEPSLLREQQGSITAKTLYEAANDGDKLALDIFDYTAKILGEALADVVTITSPQAIIFFGGLAEAGDLLFKPVHHYMEANMLNIYKDSVQLLKSALPDADAAILGASALVW